jgi:hypothetical protein
MCADEITAPIRPRLILRVVLPLQKPSSGQRKRSREAPQMRHKTSHIRGFRATLAAAGSTIHPALVPGSALWFGALAAAMLFGFLGFQSEEVRS